MTAALAVDRAFPSRLPLQMLAARDVDPTGTHVVPPSVRVVEAAADGAPFPLPARRRALVLAGGAAKGAFEVGALAELAERGIAFDSVVGTSAGALNGAYFAAGVRAGQEREAAHALIRFWQDEARWRTILDISPRDILTGRGLSTSARLERVFRERIEPIAQLPMRQPVVLRMVTTRLTPAMSGPEAGQYEHVFTFTQQDFANRIGTITRAAVASAAFPGVFAPVPVPLVGDCVDGGFVANTPLSDSIAADEVYVIAPWAPVTSSTNDLSGLSLVNQWIEILVAERFNRELNAAQQLRPQQTTHKRDTSSSGTPSRQRRADTRAPRVILIRPLQQLPGGLLAAFGDGDLRNEYIARGRAAARLALASSR